MVKYYYDRYSLKDQYTYDVYSASGPYYNEPGDLIKTTTLEYRSDYGRGLNLHTHYERLNRVFHVFGNDPDYSRRTPQFGYREITDPDEPLSYSNSIGKYLGEFTLESYEYFGYELVDYTYSVRIFAFPEARYKKDKFLRQESYDTKKYNGSSYFYEFKSKDKGKNNLIDTITAEDGTYPDDGRQGDYWYVKKGKVNQAPTISGSDLDLGGKMSNFDIEYIVQDEDGDQVKVTIYEDTIAKVSDRAVTLGTNNKYTVDLNNFSLGKHTIRIVAKDPDGETAERIYTFQKVNSAPILKSSQAGQLGDKNSPFTITYSVDDTDQDTVTIIESLNGLEIKRLTNVELGTDQSLTISKETIEAMELGRQNTIEIKADDGKGGISYLRFYFTRTNSAPVISNIDKDLGDKTDGFKIRFSATDVEKDEIYIKILVDGKEEVKEFKAEDNKEYEYIIDRDRFIKFTKGKHTIEIVARDDKGSESKRTYTFTRTIDRIEIIFEIKETERAVQKVLATPIYKLYGADREENSVKIYATNNYRDKEPVWEDITEMTLAGRAANLPNTQKTAGVWFTAVRLVINAKGEVTGFGGAIN